MFKLALKGILARKGRLLLTSLAVILGTSFLAGTYIFSDTLTKSFNVLFADVFEDTDAYVRSSVAIKGDFGSEERQRIPDSLTAEVAQVPGVKTAVSSVLGFARVIGKDGEPVGSGGNGPPEFGSSIVAEGETFWSISEGSLPVKSDEVALDSSTAKDGGYTIGDTVKVVAQAGIARLHPCRHRPLRRRLVARRVDVCAVRSRHRRRVRGQARLHRRGRRHQRRKCVRRRTGGPHRRCAAGRPADRDPHRRRGHQGESGHDRRGSELLHDLLERVLLHRHGGGVLRHLQRVLDHRGAASTRERAPARRRSAALPGHAGDVARVRGGRHPRVPVGPRRGHRGVLSPQELPRSARDRLPVDGTPTAATHHRADDRARHDRHGPVGSAAGATYGACVAIGGDA